eukprot:COSAG01_NODE_22440_length_855_cov_2.296296_1_plen_64_part_10
MLRYAAVLHSERARNKLYALGEPGWLASAWQRPMSNTAACVQAAHRTYGKWPISRDGMLNTCGE